jgi:hypothetical protein
MFIIDSVEKAKQEFSTNNLIIKLNKQTLADDAISPKELNPSNQSIHPAAEQSAMLMFEIY